VNPPRAAPIGPLENLGGPFDKERLRYACPRNSYQRDQALDGWPFGDETDTAEPITDRLAVLPDGLFLRRTPPKQPTADQVLDVGDLIHASYHHEGHVQKVFAVREREYYGLSAVTIAIGDPDTAARADGMPKRYSGRNISELVYQDGQLRMLFWNNDDVVEIVGDDDVHADYQAGLSAFAGGDGR
jgi:hypothetical protein